MPYQLPVKVYLESDKNNIHPGLPSERVYGILSAESSALTFQPLTNPLTSFKPSISTRHKPLAISWGDIQNVSSDVGHATGWLGALTKTANPLNIGTLGWISGKYAYIFIKYLDRRYDLITVVPFSLASSSFAFNKQSAANEIVREIWKYRAEYLQDTDGATVIHSRDE